MVIMTNMIMIHGMVASFAKVGGAYGEELFSQKEKVKRGGAPFHHVDKHRVSSWCNEVHHFTIQLILVSPWCNKVHQSPGDLGGEVLLVVHLLVVD